MTEKTKNQQNKAAKGAGKRRLSPRLAAASALLRVAAGGYSNIVAEHYFDSLPEARDRGFAGRLFYGVLERQLQLNHIITAYCKKPLDKLDAEVRCVLWMSLYQLLYLDSVPDSAAVNEGVLLTRQLGKSSAAGFVNGVLRAFLRDGKPELPGVERLDALSRLSVACSAPRGLCQLLLDQYGQETAEAFLQNSLRPAPVYIRVNTTKVTPAQLMEQLSQEGADPQPTNLPGCILLGRPGDITRYPAFAQGLFHVQDRSSQQCCLALNAQPGMRVLDVCAAPGGKSFTLAEQMENRGEVVAADLYPNRVGLVEKGAQRLGLSIIRAEVADAAVYRPELGSFDRVLCDVPCSGLGIIRRKPEIKYKPVQEFRELPEQQYQILAASSRYLRPGGVLIYSTCTLNKAENEQVLQRFMQGNSAFSAQAIQGDGSWYQTLLPQETDGDGFFISAVRRIQ